MLHREIYLNLNATYGPFTLDAAADSNGYNAGVLIFAPLPNPS